MPSGQGLDPSGQAQIPRNVAFSWASHLVFVVVGFIMPRMIDRQVGQEALGVWDFGWSLVTYFSLVQAGVVSSVNRYVAMFRSSGDTDSINQAISSVSCILAIMAGVIVAMTTACTFAVPWLLQSSLGGHVNDARWVVFLLGIGLAVEVGFSGFAGVLTGYHRWDLHNAVNAGSYALTAVGMVTVLFLGYGLPALALTNMGGTVLNWVTRRSVAYRVCPSLKVRLAHAHWPMARRMLTFGSKSFVLGIADMLLNQTTSLLIVAYLGPAMLALYSRPKSLIRHVRMLMNAFAFVLVPAASSLQALNRKEDLRTLLVRASAYGAYIALPATLVLCIMGGPLLRLWMGAAYEQGAILAVLAAGNLALLVQLPMWSVLAGMDLHGRPGVANLVAAVLSIPMVVVALGPLDLGLMGASLGVAIPLTVANGVYVPIFACRLLGIPLLQYIQGAVLKPVLCVIPFAALLIGSRALLSTSLVTALIGTGIGGLVLGAVYWQYVLPASLKGRLAAQFGLKSARRSSSGL